jgi:hypothetical protein
MVSRPARVVTELFLVGLAVGLCIVSWCVDDRWFLRTWSLDSRKLWLAVVIRLGAVAAGATLIFVVRPRAGAWAARVGGREVLAACVRTAGAVVLALAVSELALRLTDTPWKHDFEHQCDTRMGERDPRYGWIWRASQTFTSNVGGRNVTFAFDAEHDRAPTADFTPDPHLPTILFVGESMVAGHGLTWEESLPARVGSALGVQVFNLGVSGYGCDQSFLRLADALPRYTHVVPWLRCSFLG